ncbi:amidase [Microvirga tunisiensis]|uniref:Amidase n=2 Tax=Pannonibacter tanglangensis TaxID=2750084 RepID=A0A7X5J894_9HYPH|nr:MULTISPECIES: amidase [unclassified Pannonibacter]NBN63345.1 amidase [Pannonibacter sp. XCT-34]NBN76980.1 amidase [Pannonibacter sp. XCT-53]
MTHAAEVPLQALDLARALVEGRETPASLHARCLEAIALREAAVQAFTHCEELLARPPAPAGGAASGPLGGLPVGLKDICDTLAFPTSYGSPIYDGHRPEADSAIAASIAAAGGYVLGKTVTTEFAHLNPARTRNPHNLDHTPGGSSSGSAAGVAAGFFPLAIGTQTGGSINRPASYCGVTGFKPTFGTLPLSGTKPYSPTLDTLGLFAARVDDVAFAAAALTGQPLRTDGVEAGAPHVALARGPLWHEASDEMQAAVETAARLAERRGARVTTIDLPPEFAEVHRVHPVISDHEAVTALARELLLHADALSPILTAALDFGRKVTPEAYRQAQEIARVGRRAMAGVFGRFDVVLTPSAPGAAPRGLGSTGASTFNRAWTLIGGPTVTVSGLRDAAGLPLGVQVCGPARADARTLLAAAFLERAIRTG